MRAVLEVQTTRSWSVCNAPRPSASCVDSCLADVCTQGGDTPPKHELRQNQFQHLACGAYFGFVVVVACSLHFPSGGEHIVLKSSELISKPTHRKVHCVINSVGFLFSVLVCLGPPGGPSRHPRRHREGPRRAGASREHPTPLSVPDTLEAPKMDLRSPSTFRNVVWGRRGRPDPKSRRFPTGPTTM